MPEIPAAIDRVDVHALRVHLVADAGVNQQARGTVVDEERTRGELDPVAFVGRSPALPQRLGDDTEHRPPVEPEVAVEKRRQLQITEADRRLHFADRSCFNSTSTPCVLEGWMKATSEWCAPGRGTSSINLTPFAFSSASAETMSSTRRQR